MAVSTPDTRRLKALAYRLDALLSQVNFEVKGLQQSQGIEFDAFVYVLDADEIPSEEKGWALYADYNRHNVIKAVSELKDLWARFQYWLYDGQLKTLAEWKPLWNSQTQKWNKPLLT